MLNKQLVLPSKKRLLAQLISGVSLMGLAHVAMAQNEGASTQTDDAVLREEVIVTGYRGALLTSTNAKRESTGFSDAIFSDDIGKMPSQNLAESLNRIPGVKLSREITGEGQQIQVRGLGSGFTKIAMNGNNMAVASTGSLDAGNRNREIDLDMFPPELFSSLTVHKTVMAHQLEGGVSGYVNMRTVRPSDFDDQHVQFSVEGSYGELSEKVSPRGSFLFSKSDEKWGVLVGIAGAQNKTRVDGYEAVSLYTDGCVAEWTNPEQTNSNCIDGSQGLNHFFWSPEATADYAAAHPGVSVGDPIDPVATSGLSADVLDNAKLPYIGRPMTTVGDRNRVSALVSLEYRPTDTLELTLDLLSQEAKRQFVRTEAMWWGRRNYLHQGAAIIPENVTVNEQGYVTSGTFYNSHLWVGSRDYDEDLSFLSVMPGLTWQPREDVELKVAFNRTTSDFERDEPYVLYTSPAGTMEYKLTGGIPSFNFSHDPADPNIDWTWQKEYDVNGDGVIEASERFNDRFRVNRNKRKTENTGLHVDLALGDDPDLVGFKVGFAWDENISEIRAFGADAAFNALVDASPANDNFKDYLTSSIVNDLGSGVSGYSGYGGIAQVDWGKIKDSVNYGSYQPNESTGDQFGQGNGTISEEVLALYVEANMESEVLDRPLRINSGVRWVSTDQRVSTMTGETKENYTRFLPSLSMVYDLADDIKVRASASRTLTRANPADMYPNATWNTSGVESIRAGNPYLEPFEATNFDIGGEWYFNDLGYVGLTYFEKQITGFTKEDTVSVLIADLVNYGVDITPEGLGVDRTAALESCGGANVCTTRLSTRNNVGGTARIEGWEAMWVMPLDMIVEGMGFDVSATHLVQHSPEEAQITGISPWTYNFTAYYENDWFQGRITYFNQDGAVSGYTQGLELISMDRSQVDFSTSFRLPFGQDYNLSLSFDGYNITDEPIGSWHEYEGITFSSFYPGATYTIGLRGSF